MIVRAPQLFDCLRAFCLGSFRALLSELEQGADLIRAVYEDLAAGRPRPQIAAAFHEGVAAAAAAACEAAVEPKLVVLSGGTFQNVRLLRSVGRRLEERGFRVLSHSQVPPNDGGISYGQAAIAAASGWVRWSP